MRGGTKSSTARHMGIFSSIACRCCGPTYLCVNVVLVLASFRVVFLGKTGNYKL